MVELLRLLLVVFHDEQNMFLRVVGKQGEYDDLGILYPFFFFLLYVNKYLNLIFRLF